MYVCIMIINVKRLITYVYLIVQKTVEATAIVETITTKILKEVELSRTLHIQEIKVIADYIYWKWNKLQCKCGKNQGLLLALSVVMPSTVYSSTLAYIVCVYIWF